MSKQRATFAKLQRDQEKQARAAAKRERRAARTGAGSGAPEPAGPQDQESILAALASLHQSYDDGVVGLEEFEARRDELRSKLRVD